MRAQIVQRLEGTGKDRRESREAENAEGVSQQGDHHELHLSGFDFLAEKLGGPPDHHSNEKNRKDCERNQVDQADAVATEHIIEHHLRDWDQPADRRQRIVHCVDRASRSGRCHCDEQTRLSGSEAQFLSFEIAPELRSGIALIGTNSG
jgi:hypothetical protein